MRSGVLKFKSIYLVRNKLPKCPEVFNTMLSLQSIDVGYNHLTSLPVEVCKYPNLTSLYINDNYLTELPAQIIDLDLEVVHVAGNMLCRLSPEITSWLNKHDWYKENSQWLTYQQCNTFSRDSLTVLRVLSENGWTNLSVSSVSNVVDGNIVAIDLSYNNRMSKQGLSKSFTKVVQSMILSQGIDSLKYLRSLNLSGNYIDSLPNWFGSMCHLHALNLSNNRLKTLPDFMSAFAVLDTLNLSSNEIVNLPPKVEMWADALSPGWKNTQSYSSASFLYRMISAPFYITRNPHNEDNFQVNFSQSSFANVAIYSLGGRCIMTTEKRRYEPGTRAIPIKTSLLPHGTYIMLLNAGNLGSSTLRFVVD
jgi:Leucine-rich repeat (LRR) protein